MINGTKLLNVAGMTRGRRDGILKSEKTRHVVKIGPMHLKGVWIPFDRALDFANKEKITEQLYPLFVHDIGALLYHPSNQPRPGLGNSSALAAVDRRRSDARLIGAPPTTSAPPLHHHHSMSAPMSQPPHSIAPHPSSGRPGLDRAHTFPTPPTSASSNFGGVPQHSSYEWSNGQPLQIDTGLSNTRPIPTTPASTPPGIQQYQTSQPYDSSRQMYTAPPAQYPSQMRQFGGPLPSTTIKSDMAPPPRAGDAEHPADSKPQDGHDDQGDHESAYTHTQAAYGAPRGSYSYNPNAPAVARVGEDVNSSPHQNGSSRETPRTAGDAQWQSGYGAPSNQGPTGNVYNPIEPRANGDSYVPFPSTYVNGSIPSAKRVRELDEDADDDLKRQKTGHEDGGPVGSPFSGANRQRAQPVSQKGRR
jgi:protein SOK2